jgi:hypothetical protein
MEKMMMILGVFALFWVFCWAFITCLDREAKRQCIVAQDHCVKYSDAGACDPKYLAVCEGVEDDK